MAKKFFKAFAALLLGCILALAAAELSLRIFNPFSFRVKGNKIVLEFRKKLIITNKTDKKLDSVIYHTKNSLGFRGEDPPLGFKNYLTVLSMGGSTTECFYLSDGKTWTDVLGQSLKQNFKQVWINNAGLDGFSSFGDTMLMQDYIIKLKPKILLFLVGLNEVDRKDLGKYDRMYLRKKPRLSWGFINYVKRNSEFIMLTENMFRYFRSVKRDYVHRQLNLVGKKLIEIPERKKALIEQEIKESARDCLARYKERLTNISNMAKQKGIELVFITQPALYGFGIDEVSKADLGRIKTNQGNSGEIEWYKLELYNDITRQVAKQEGLLLVDLAKEMPKSSRYYYDFEHYTNEGAQKVAEILYKYLCPFLTVKYKSFLTRRCGVLN